MAKVIEVLGPHLGTELPPEWEPVVKRTNSWTSCRLRSHWFAASVDGEIAGVGAIDTEWGDGIAWTGPTYVLEKFRGLGIQSKLIAKRLELAKQVGVKRVQTAVDVTNTTSLRNLLNARFKIVDFDDRHRHIEVRYDVK